MFMEARVKLSVPINGLWIGFNNIALALRRFVTPALFHHEGQEVFDLSSAGTAFLVRYRARNFGICTRHQLGTGTGAVSMEQFTVLADGGKLGLSPNRVSRVRMEASEHKNLEDLFVADYADERDGRDLRSLFLEIDLSVNLRKVSRGLLQASFALGFPTFARDGEVELDEHGMPVKWATEARWVKLYLRADEARPLDVENRLPMVQDERADQETIDPDGMSGAPVFFIGKTEEHDAFLGFAGMITDAVDRRYMVYDAAILKDVLDNYIDQPD